MAKWLTPDVLMHYALTMRTTPTALVGANIRAEMARRQISQMTMAAYLGVSQAQVSKRLQGRIPFDINELSAIAAYLRVPLALLLHHVNDDELNGEKTEVLV